MKYSIGESNQGLEIDETITHSLIHIISYVNNLALQTKKRNEEHIAKANEKNKKQKSQHKPTQN